MYPIVAAQGESLCAAQEDVAREHVGSVSHAAQCSDGMVFASCSVCLVVLVHGWELTVGASRALIVKNITVILCIERCGIGGMLEYLSARESREQG